MNLNDKLTFGKYKKYTIKEVIEDDPTYLEWCLDEIKGFKLSDEAMNMLDDALIECYNYEPFDYQEESLYM